MYIYIYIFPFCTHRALSHVFVGPFGPFTGGSAEPGTSARAADRLLPCAEEVRRLGDLLLGDMSSL